MDDLDARRPQPVAIDDAREANPRVRIVRTRRRLHVERDDEFTVGHAALRRDDRALRRSPVEAAAIEARAAAPRGPDSRRESRDENLFRRRRPSG